MSSTETLMSAWWAARYARLLDYPKPEFPSLVAQIRSEIEPMVPAAAISLGNFLEEIAERGQTDLEELFTRTFDIAAQCIPYLSIHVFGEENYRRATLMVGLVESYRREGFNHGSELPDHVTTVLSFAPHFRGDEWADIMKYALLPSFEPMIRSLMMSNNPYRHLFRALQTTLVTFHSMEACPCSTPSC